MASNLAGICGGRVKALWPLPAGRRAYPARLPTASHGDPLTRSGRPGHRRPIAPQLSSAARRGRQAAHRPRPRPSGTTAPRPPRRLPPPPRAAITVPMRPAGRAALDFETGRRHRPPRSCPPSRTPDPTRPPRRRRDSPPLTGAAGRTHRAAGPGAKSGLGQPRGFHRWRTPASGDGGPGGRAALPRPGRRRRRRGPPWRGRRARPDRGSAGASSRRQTPTGRGCGNPGRGTRPAQRWPRGASPPLT
ncbi:putative uncharacterized protein encoded by LINC00612 [Aquila chrysaetos chrysaetos]|uniref:putative uncharacterized protein encoded by LINC00612 n=1 Tax=Aquila chrysaetos chrysaetos TaxID=223781 RepID=UPI0005D05400|nr:putative uncharacterized protein encoded by LINC00612 [Aquila chrysaetos chrysaetos]